MTAGHTFEAVVDEVAQLLHHRIGLRPDTTLRGRLRRAIRDEASRHGEEPASYVQRLLADGSFLQSLMNLVTVQETGFFRHPEQFEVLARDVLPDLPRPVRIWSAACANGQEAYSLAILLEEGGIDGSVVASELSTDALRRTDAARYTRRELSGVSATRLAQHFRPVGELWKVAPQVRERVITLHHNLLDPLPHEVLGCQVVFCRNVLIYLSPQQVRLFLDRIADDLAATTTLFVGAAETIWQVSDRFQAVHAGSAFMYRQRPTEPVQQGPVFPPPVPPVPAVVLGRRRQGAAPLRAGRRRPDMMERPVMARAAQPAPEPDEIAALERAAQAAVAAGDHEAAVVAFRKCAYLQPHDPLAQLHLGLALEAAGDLDAARRAYAAARLALTEAGFDLPPERLEGYSVAELVRMLDSKR